MLELAVGDKQRAEKDTDFHVFQPQFHKSFDLLAFQHWFFEAESGTLYMFIIRFVFMPPFLF